MTVGPTFPLPPPPPQPSHRCREQPQPSKHSAMWDTCIHKSLLVLSVLTQGIKEPGMWGSLVYDVSRPGPGGQQEKDVDGRCGASALGRSLPSILCSLGCRCAPFLPDSTRHLVLCPSLHWPGSLLPLTHPSSFPPQCPLQVLLLPGHLPFLAQSCPSSEICLLQEAPPELEGTGVRTRGPSWEWALGGGKPLGPRC